MTTSALIHIESARLELARARSLPEVKSLRDKARAVHEYLREQGECLEIQNEAAELKLRAERRLGELLAEKVEAHRPSEVSQRATVLPDGITRSQSSRWQRVASVSPEAFEAHLAERRDRGDEITTAGVLELAQRHQAEHRTAERRAQLARHDPHGLADLELVERLDLKLQPFDVWTFNACDDRFGDAHPGRIPGQLVAHIIYFFSGPGDVVLDPMAGSGTTVDVCKALGRQCFAFDLDHRHERTEIVHSDLRSGWPAEIEKTQLVVWDPPYFDKMDSENIGKDGYIEGSISKLSRDGYLAFFHEAFARAHSGLRAGARIALVMSDWTPQPGDDREGIFVLDYGHAMRAAGFTIERIIQAPLTTQQVHPDVVNRFREQKRLARLSRNVLVGRR